jgi:hypothetical protein
MCLHVAIEILELGGKIKKTVQWFYKRDIKNDIGYGQIAIVRLQGRRKA